MEKYMAIDLKEGKAVRLSKGLMNSAKIYSNEPWELAKRFSDAGAKWLHIVDLDGAINIQRFCYQQDIEYMSYYIDCEPRIRLKRSLNRQPNADKGEVKEMCRRLLDDEMKIASNKEISIFDVLLKNNTKYDFIDCVMEISKIIEGEN